MRVHYLQHVFYEGLGHIGRWLDINGHVVSSTKFYGPAEKLPDQQDFDALIILGGPMGVGQLEEFPWLEQEKDFILDSIENGKPVLGICLGAQLIASVLGGKVAQPGLLPWQKSIGPSVPPRSNF